jgi:hypothetical protein
VASTTYTHTGFDPTLGHTWEVTAVCGASESTGSSMTKAACRAFIDCEDIIIGTGTTGAYNIPINTFYRHSYVQEIFDAAEIGAAGEISTVAFQYIWTAPQTEPVSIYLGNTTKSTFAGTTDWVPVSQMELVYDGAVTFDDTGTNNWVRITLDTPFEYSGDNLVIAILDNSGTYYTSSNNTFYTHAATGTKTIHYYSDAPAGGSINPAAPPTASTATTSRNNILFEVCPIGDCDPVTSLAVSYTAGCDAELTWTAPAGTGTIIYNIYRDGTMVASSVTAASYTDTGFDATIGHSWIVRVICDDGFLSSAVSVALPACCNPASDLVVTYTAGCDAELSWTGSAAAYNIYCDGALVAGGVASTT